MSKVDLRVDWCSHEAAKYAVEHWHYSKVMPTAKPVKMGAWENGNFIGAVVFSVGANKNIGSPYGLKQTEVAELVRVSLTNHISAVSQIVSLAIKALRQQSPGLRLLVSYADPAQDHHGGIYQAMNWVYEGRTKPISVLNINGKLTHKKTASSRYGTNSAEKLGATWVTTVGKHKYLYPLDRAMRRQIEPLAKPYPKRANVGEMESRADTIG